MKPLKLEVLFGSKDHLSPALKLMIGSSNAAAKALKSTRDELKKLNDQQKQIEGFSKQKKATEDSAKALKDVQDRIKSLRQDMATNPSDKLSKDFDQATKQAKKLKDAHSQNQIKLQELRNELKQTGVSTGNLAEHQVDLSRKITSANTSIDSQKKKLENLNRIQQSNSKMSGNVHTAALAGTGMVATGTAALWSMRKPIEESKRVDIEQARIASLGLGQQSTAEAIKYAKAMKTFGTSTLDNLQLVRDGVTAFADVHHAQMVAPTLAKMKFANEAMYGGEHGAENEKKFMDMLKVIEMRNGLKSEKAFHEQANIIQQVITATGGRVQAEEWLNVIKTGGIAAKGMDNKAFYYKMEPLVQEMGGFRVGTSMMSAYQNLYQGRTTQRAAANLDKFGLIGDYSKVKHNKTGDLSYLDIGAIKGAELFKKDQFAWMEQVLVPALNAKGITKESDVIDAIGSIFSNRTASNLFSQMYMQRNQIHKNAKLNEGAYNIDQLDSQAQNTTAGKELEAKAKLHDAYLQFGQTILPIYTQALVMAGNAMQTFTGWMQKNPALAKTLGTALLAVAVGLVAIGGTLVALSPLILSVLSLRLMLSTLSITSTAVGMGFRLLMSPIRLFGTSLLWLGRILLLTGQMMLANPILLAVTLTAAAAYLIYRNWTPIKQFFSELWASIQGGINDAWNAISRVFAPVGLWFSARWAEIQTVFSGGIQHLSSTIQSWSPLSLFYAAFASVMNWFGVELPSKFTGFGQMIIQGLIKGLNQGFDKLKSKWQEINSYMPDWMRKKMDIHSPSRVMAGLGHFIMQGINVGLDQGFPSLKNKFNTVLDLFQGNAPQVDLKSRFSNAFGQLAQSNTPQQVFDPIASIQSMVTKVKAVQLSPTSSKAQRPMVIEGDTITVQIHAQQGHSVQDLIQQFEQFLQRREREKQAKARTRFFDDE